MIRHKLITLSLVVMLMLSAGHNQSILPVSAQAPLAPFGTSFTYQGRLMDSSGNPTTDTCDFRFILYDTAIGGAQVGPIIDAPISVTDGYFTVLLDFGGSAFTGEARWLEAAVKCSGDEGYTTLSPRQQLTLLPHTHWGQSWSGTGTGLDLSGGITGLSGSGTTTGVSGTASATNGRGLSGVASSTSGGAIGVRGESYSAGGFGVYGMANATSGITFGVAGLSGSNAGSGVYGYAYATDGTNIGVFGRSDSTQGAAGYFTNISGSGVDRGWGVRAFTGSGIPADVHPGGYYDNAAGEFAGPNGLIGAASSDHEGGYGVIGLSDGTNGLGVLGYARAVTGETFGVYGSSDSTAGTGVRGSASASTGSTYGVYGRSSSSSGAGVCGYANSTSGVTKGIYGISDSPDGVGVYGHSTSTTGSHAYGVYGRSDSSSGGAGLYGIGTAPSGTTFGVRGESSSPTGYGVYGTAWISGANAGIYGSSGSNDGFGVAGYNTSTGVGVGAWSSSGNLIEAYDGAFPGGALRFYVDQSGNVYADGTYNTFIINSLDGYPHGLSSLQSTEAWLEDFGRASLVDGVAVVNIAPDFAGVANLSVEYHVFLTPMGDSQGLYVTNLTPTSFEVREQNGGKSEIAFSYRIVAKPYGSETARLPVVIPPDPTGVPGQPDISAQDPQEQQP